MTDYPDFSMGEIGAMFGQRNKGHVRVHNADKKTANNTLNFKQEGVNVSFKDSWRGEGPFAELTRSIIMENGLNTQSGVVHYNEKVFTENSQNGYPEGITRLVVPLSPTDPGIRRLQLGILLQHHPSQIEHVSDMDVDGTIRPVTLLSPAVWEDHVVKAQSRMWQKDHEAYRRLAPVDVFRGWKLDGIVERDDLALGPLIERVRELTVIIRNKVSVRTYWRFARCGSQVGIVIKKWACKRRIALRDVADDESFGGVSHQQVPMTPYTIGFYSTTYGQEPSARIYEYVDDDGHLRSDGLVIQLGTSNSVPRGGYTLDTTEPEFCEAFHEDLECQIADQYTPMEIFVDIKIK